MNAFTSYRVPQESLEKMMKSFEEIPRDGNKEDSKMKMDKKEVQAVENLKELLELIEKQMNGSITEKEKADICGKKEDIRESIEVLREYLSEHRIFEEK